ncbi:MAG: RsmE family RNA methyltransferase [Pirellula sp.]|jgi:16S rRNA (uracil1498-N3)-methyltransferase
MALPRFLVDDVPERGFVSLDEAESNHAARVLRVQPGEDVIAFDGKGWEGYGSIDSVQRKTVTLNIQQRRFAPRDHDDRLWMAIALPKGDRQRSVIERMVELGVDRLIPLHSHRSVARCDADAIERLDRYGIEACKQCQRNRRMRIEPAMDWNAFMDWLPAQSSTECWLLHPDPTAIDAQAFLATSTALPTQSMRWLFTIGPEGGFTDAETSNARTAGCRVLSLGERILRVETAVASAAFLGHLALARMQSMAGAAASGMPLQEESASSGTSA